MNDADTFNDKLKISIKLDTKEAVKALGKLGRAIERLGWSIQNQETLSERFVYPVLLIMALSILFGLIY